MAKRLCLSPTCRLASLSLAQTLPPLALRYEPPRRGARSAPASSPATTFATQTPIADKQSPRERAVKDFATAVVNEALAGIRRLYPRVIAATVLRTGDTAQLQDVGIHRSALQAAMRLLSSSCAENNADYELLWRIFEDLQRVFLVKPDLDECSYVLRGMVAHGRLREAYEWLKALGAVYRVTPSVREWNIVLAGVERHVRSAIDPSDGIGASAAPRAAGADIALLQAIYSDMLQSSVQPDITSYNTLMTVFAAKGDINQLRAGMDDMRHRGLAPNAQTHAIFLRGCMAVGDIEGARVASKALLNQPLTEDVDVDAWNSLLLVASLPPQLSASAETEAESEDEASVLAGGPEAVVQRMRLRGATPNVDTLNAIIRASRTPLDSLATAAMLLDEAEELAGVDANAETVSIIVRRVLGAAPDSAAGGRAALAIYTEAVRGARAVVSSSDLVLPIIQALRVGQGSELDLAAVQGMYNDVRSAFEAGNGGTPSVDLYREVLGACAVSTAGSKWARTLLADMQQFQHVLPMDAVIALATPIMRVAPDYNEAYNVLVGFHNLDPKRIDTPAAEALLKAYLDLPMVAEPAPLARVTELVQMFRMVDAHFGAEGYSALFRHYGGENASGIGHPRAILRFHTILSLDRRFDPTTPVLNDLIRAYASAGAGKDAWKAWEAMLLSPQRALWDSGTITAVLDLCGSTAGATGDVLDPRPVWKLARTREAVDPSFRLPKRAWDAWIGALARVGTPRQLDFATDVVVGQMGRGQMFRPPLEGADLAQRAHPPPAADAATVDTLLRYAHARGGVDLLAWLRDRIRKHLPELWPDVAEVERFEWDEVYRLRGQHQWPDFGDEPWYDEASDKVWPPRQAQVDVSM